MGNGFRTDPCGGVASPPYTNGPYGFSEKISFNDNVRLNTNRYHLEEFFSQTPGVNADLASATEATRVPRNKHFEVLGTNGTSALATFSAVEGGLKIATAGADNDQMIILPHLDTKQTAWTGIKWGTENQVIWDCAIRTGASIATLLIWAGLKLTNVAAIATDANQVLFRYSTDDSDTTWRCISSIANVDTNTDSGVTVAANTIVFFRIELTSNRTAEFYIDNVKVHTTAALTNDIDLIPYVGIQSLSGAADNITICYEKISRILFE